MASVELHPNPARDVAFLRRKSPGKHTWTEDEIARFEARWPVGSKPRLAVALLLYTAQRRSEPPHGPATCPRRVVHVRQQKTGAVWHRGASATAKILATSAIPH